MFLFAGLGNPGSEYQLTRHNIGFMIIDAIAKEFSFPSFTKRFDSLSATGVIEESKVILLKPQTFMNSSGKAIIQTLNFYKIQPYNLIVFHDDIDLKFGNIKVKIGGSSAGHNGIKSIDDSVGKDYWRLRFGVGRPDNKTNMACYVLSKFEDITAVNNLIDHIAKNVYTLTGKNKDSFSSIF